MVTEQTVQQQHDVNELLMSINDSLIYIDEEISNDQRQNVNNMIEQELSQYDTTVPHPLLADKPNISTESQLVRDMYIREDDDSFTIGGVDMAKYTNLTTEDDELNYQNLYSSMAHSNLRRRNLLLNQSAVNVQNNRNEWLIHNEELSQYNDVLEQELVNKRKLIDEVNVRRKRRQLEFQPMNNYLKQRWEESVRGCIDVGIECAKLELDDI